jgi:hypothetical protein
MKHLNLVFSIGCLAVLVAGCASAPSHFYTLDATAKRAGDATANYGVMVGPVFVPASVERPQFVVNATSNRAEVEEFNRWAAPLDDSIARVVSVNLGELLDTVRVISAPMPNFGPAYHVTLRVERFESTRGEGNQNGSALLDAVWAVSNPKGEPLASGRFTQTEPAPGNSFEAIAAAHSRNLAKLSGTIANALNASAGEKP